VALNIKRYFPLTSFVLFAASVSTGVTYFTTAHAKTVAIEPVHACVLATREPLSHSVRSQIADCLGWQTNTALPICRGTYKAEVILEPLNADETQINADSVSFYPTGRSTLKGHVRVRQTTRVVNAQTAYVYRDEKTNQVTQIQLLGQVRYLEPGKLMLARKASLDPRDKSGRIEDVLYRFNVQRAHAMLPAWGRASFVERFANQDYLLRSATYSTCAPRDKAWLIQAREIKLDNAKGTGVAKDAVLRVADWPVLYSPYLSFPTSNERKSGFLMPMYGYSNVGGFDLAAPYYLNIAPNVDATFVPHAYSLRGVMLGGDVRFLTDSSRGVVGGNFLPKDRAFNQFLMNNSQQYPSLNGLSTDRWSFLIEKSGCFGLQLILFC